MINLKERIKQARIHAGFTQPELADKLGISSRTLQRYETEDSAVSKITLVSILRISELCGVNVIWLISSRGEMAQADNTNNANKRDCGVRNIELLKQFDDQATLNKFLQNLLIIEHSPLAFQKLEAYVAGAANGLSHKEK